MVIVKRYDEPQLNIKDILRYMGCKEISPEISALIDSCLLELKGKLNYKVCYDIFDIDISSEVIDLDFTKCKSNDLHINLESCQKALIFAATIGIEIDRLIAKYSKLSPSKALCLQAIGAERIESLCDVFNDEISKEFLAKGYYTRPRFSPGYGDLSLELQKDIFATLDCARKIGLSLNESLLMSPSKSVTAIIGISDEPKSCKKPSCSACTKLDCSFRRKY